MSRSVVLTLTWREAETLLRHAEGGAAKYDQWRPRMTRKALTKLKAALSEENATKCSCKPCPDCGYKHYCNLEKDHSVKPRTGDCRPASAVLR